MRRERSCRVAGSVAGGDEVREEVDEGAGGRRLVAVHLGPEEDLLGTAPGRQERGSGRPSAETPRSTIRTRPPLRATSRSRSATSASGAYEPDGGRDAAPAAQAAWSASGDGAGARRDRDGGGEDGGEEERGRHPRKVPANRPEGVAVRLDTSASSGKLPLPVTEGKVVIACRSAGPVEVVSLSGTLDAWSEPDVRAALKAVLERGKGRLVLDLAAPAPDRLVRPLGAPLRPQGGPGRGRGRRPPRPSAAVVSVLRLTRLDQILEAYDDEGAALARLSA